MNEFFNFGDIGYLGLLYNWFGMWIECGVIIFDDVYVYWKWNILRRYVIGMWEKI